jgi:CheY-like chemotaxis protein
MYKNVLIVDDSKTVRTLIKMVLVDEDTIQVNDDSIYQANDGVELIEAFDKYNNIDYVVADINMPNKKGDIAIEELKCNGKLINTNVIFITTESRKVKELMYRNQSIIGFIQKPVNIDTLPQELQKIADNAKQLPNEQEKKEIDTQVDLITKIASEYYEVAKVSSSEFDETIFKNIAKSFIRYEKLQETQMLKTSQDILTNYLEFKNINKKVETSKFVFVYKNIVCENRYRNSRLTINSIATQEIQEYLKEATKIEKDLDFSVIAEDFFGRYSEIVDSFEYINSNEFLDFNQKYTSSQVEVLEIFFNELINFAKKVDPFIYSYDIKEYSRYASLLSAYSQMLEQLSNTPYKVFETLSKKYQPKYSATNDYLATLQDGEEEYTKINSLLQEYSNEYEEECINSIKEYTTKMDKDLIFKGYKYCVFMIYNKLFSDMKKSDDIKEYYLSERNSGRFTLYTMIDFALCHNIISERNSKDIKKLYESFQEESYVCVYLTDERLDENDGEVSKLELSVKKMGRNWKFYAFNRNNVFSIWLKSNRPNVIIMDYEYDKNDDVPFTAMLEKYQFLQSADVVLCSDMYTKLSNKNIISMCSAYIKKPFHLEKVVKALTFI